MTATYRCGYGTTRRTAVELNSWSRWTGLHPEMRRRYLALMDAARAAAVDLGIGGGSRTEAEQFALFDARHDPATAGCCRYQSKTWKLVTGAHAAPPGVSYHEPTVLSGGVRYAVAVDAVGWENGWLQANCGRFGLRTFAGLAGSMNEPWHCQPIELPTSRASYDPAVHVLKVWALPSPSPAPSPIDVPTPTLRSGSTGQEVRELQSVCKFWGFYPFTVDGSFGARTVDAVKQLQGMLKLTQDGVYGPVTATAYRNFVAALSGA